MSNSTDWIRELNLAPHPEGGYFREFYRSDQILSGKVLPENYSGDRNMGSIIYYLLRGDEFSAFHRLQSDEVWHFHSGSAFALHIISPEGNYRTVRLGRELPKGDVPCYAIPAGYFFGAEVAEHGNFALASCTVIPGFSFEDFHMPSRQELIALFPSFAGEITHLTREG